MLREALEHLKELHADASEFKRLHSDPRETVFGVAGEVKRLILPEPPRSHTALTIESFAGAVARHIRGDADELSPVATWVSLEQAVAVLDDFAHRCDRVQLPVQSSPFFERLAASDWLSQQQMVNLFRHDLCGASIDPGNTLAVLRNLRFSTESQQSGQYDNASAKLGKSVASQVTGEANLPEAVAVEFHPYPQLADEVDVSVVVFCTLFVDAERARLRLCPRPGELDAARTKATRALREAIAEAMAGLAKDTPVFCGMP